ncbi:hypothetical protein HN51_033496 [Arachis hypogaea]|uniref:BUB1 N-terminal domain-containing protein n=1 Tax=Arachis hypogaea TaxID=3818 RepID=A0A445B0Q2_ARAHY|nr:mitotic spindle checkpoint protein BUBR1 [Arachis hypogaea]QHO18011.1 Mitotic spindle checkpoint protein [Arachis hypogaea]RYR32265.1 hypothetical protein Ahy_A10g046848 [Arachis hypogaea]
MAETAIEKVDPETEFLASKRQTGYEWETFKENVRPLKRGRNVNLLNHALKSYTDNNLKNSLYEHRRKLIEAIDEYKGEDPLLPWLQCIKWVQEAFPPCGDGSGLVVIYEKCVQAFWDSDRYKDDLRYLKVWLEYADNCLDAEVIYAFLEANGIGKTHSDFYISYGLHLESKNKIKTANRILELGISRNAQPVEKLKAAYRKFVARSMARSKATDDSMEKPPAPVRSFGTVLAKGQNRTHLAPFRSDPSDSSNSRSGAAPLSVYKDSVGCDDSIPHQTDISNSWHTLGPRAERNKENNAIPGKWKSYKIPQRPGTRTGIATASACIPVFVDEECQESQNVKEKSKKSSCLLQLRWENEKDLKRETEQIRKNPLRKFPQSSLPR